MTSLRFFLIRVLDDSFIVLNSLKDTFQHIYLFSVATIQRIETDSVFLYLHLFSVIFIIQGVVTLQIHIPCLICQQQERDIL